MQSTTRITRYQESINKFIKNKSIITEYHNKENILKVLNNNSDYMISILVSTIIITLNKANNFSGHAYYSTSFAEFLILLTRINERKTQEWINSDENKNLRKTQELNLSNITNDCISSLNIFLSQSIEVLTSNLYKEGKESKDKIIKNTNYLTKIVNFKINEILANQQIKLRDEFITRTDLFNYNKLDNDEIKKTIKKLKRIDKKTLLEEVDRTYGNACRMAINLAFIMGNGDLNTLIYDINKKEKKKQEEDRNKKIIEKIGTNMGILLKIHYDWKNIENDIKNCLSERNTFGEGEMNYINNIIINIGIQESFELFMEAKQRVIENLLHFNLYTNTTKEVLDYLEEGIDMYINELKPDLRSNYTISSDKSSS
jgi:hypothetical protein